MEFKPGTKVNVIDEDLSGTVLRLEGKWVWIECDDGFEYKYPRSSLYALNDKGDVEFYPEDIVLHEDDELKKKKTVLPKINFQGKKPEFDLHMEALFPDSTPSGNNEILSLKLEYAADVIQKAIEVRVRNIVFIHGIGQGILRQELRSMLTHRFPNVEYFDADYMRYGHGATEVIINGLGSI